MLTAIEISLSKGQTPGPKVSSIQKYNNKTLLCYVGDRCDSISSSRRARYLAGS